MGQRTGDTPSAERARQDKRLPTALVTTPESLSLMLTRERAAQELAGVQAVIVDEWHELIGNKRGVQVQLALARLRRWNPGLAVWGLSATLSNLADAMVTLCGERATLVRGRVDKAIVIDTLLPKEPGRFSWGGHLGAQMQQPVVEEIERTMQTSGGTTLVFTNVRSQAEIWYQLLLAARPEWAGQIALPPRLARQERARVGRGGLEGWLAQGGGGHVEPRPRRRFPAGRARAADRQPQGRCAPAATRRPQRPCAGARQPRHAGADQHARTGGGGGGAASSHRRPRVESRTSPDKPLDVLVQHLVTDRARGWVRS